MPIAALVLTLDPDHTLQAAVQKRLAADPRFSLGSVLDGRLPVVIETATSRDGAHLTRELEQREGIHYVDVVMVDFSDEV